MSTTGSESSPTTEPAAIRAWAKKRMIYVELTDGRIVD